MTLTPIDLAAAAASLAPLPVAASLLGESPLWHPDEQVLYWCDIPGRQLHRYDPRTQAHRHWDFAHEPSCCVPLLEGGLVLSLRDGLVRFDPVSGQSLPLAGAPYDTRHERFNDGKADPQGRLWVGTIYEPREPALAALYRYAGGRLDRIAGDITVSNGLGFSPDGRTMYWSDTKAHAVYAYDFDGADGSLSHRRVFAQFEPKVPGQDLDTYAGRPDGAAVDSEGGYWVAMMEGQRILRLAPDGSVLGVLPLPVRCPTMCCFGGADLRTLYITTSRENRSAAELAAQPWAGRVLQCRVPVAGLAAHVARLGSPG